MAQLPGSDRGPPASDPPQSGHGRLRAADGSIMRRIHPENPELIAALARLKALEERLGDDGRLTTTNTQIIADVLRDAGVAKTAEMSRALAPLVVSSMREEIKNSSDEMVSALYPIMGRLVASYVRGAFVELTEKINQALEDNFSLKRWKIRLKARMTGRSEAELLLAEARPFSVDDLFVVHRKSGLLISRAEENNPEAPDAELVSAMLSAIMSFVEDAFQSDADSTLRAISFGDSRLVVRATPGLVLAAKTTGIQPPGFEAAFDEAAMAFTGRWGQALMHFDGGSPPPKHDELVRALGAITAALPAPELTDTPEDDGPEDESWMGRMKALPTAAKILVPVLVAGGLIVWAAGESREERQIRMIAETLQADEFLRRFALQVVAEDGAVIVRGWLPGPEALARLKSALPPPDGAPPIGWDVFTTMPGSPPE